MPVLHLLGIVRWNGEHNEPFDIRSGVRQGCIVSPSLFSLYTEDILREADIGHLGVDVGGRKLSNLRYASDTALLASTANDIDELVEKVNDSGKEKLVNFNVKKTKLLRIDKRNEHTYEVTVNGAKIEEVDYFKYLGSVKTRYGSCSKDIKTRVAIAKKKTLDLTNVWKNRNIEKNVKIKLVKTLIWSVITYGAEAWTMFIADEKKIMAAEQWIYRRMLRVSWCERRTNESILEEVGEAPGLLPQTINNKLAYFGHMCREGGCQLTKAAVLGLKGGIRSRGRPRTCYTDNVKRWVGVELSEAVILARDRTRWRNGIWNASTSVAERLGRRTP